MLFAHAILLFSALVPAKSPAYDRAEDVIYGRKAGLALTMDVFTPKGKPNGAGVIYIASVGWMSDKKWIIPTLYDAFLARGYVVFVVIHGSQPRFTIPDAIEDVQRAVRYVRYWSKYYGIDAERIGIAGGSAGGHLALMQAYEPREGDPMAADPVEQQSSRVAAVACFSPPTDFLNFGKAGEEALGTGRLSGFPEPFDFELLDPKTKLFHKVSDPKMRAEIGRRISPIYHVTDKSAPALIIHGDADEIVPIQQSESLIAKLKDAKVPCELIVKPGAGHGWANMEHDAWKMADWFDVHLKK